MIIPAEVREVKPKLARKLRREGKVPGVIYGANFENKHIALDKSKLMSILRKSNRNDVFELDVKGDEKYEVVVKSIQWHPVTDEIVHIDFYKLTKGQPITVDVPIKLVGEAKGVKLGGDLYQPRKSITVVALPEAIPKEIEVDISDLDIGDVIHVFDLEMPEGVKIKSSKNYTLVAIVGKVKEETEEAEEELEEVTEEEEKQEATEG